MKIVQTNENSKKNLLVITRDTIKKWDTVKKQAVKLDDLEDLDNRIRKNLQNIWDKIPFNRQNKPPSYKQKMNLHTFYFSQYSDPNTTTMDKKKSKWNEFFHSQIEILKEKLQNLNSDFNRDYNEAERYEIENYPEYIKNIWESVKLDKVINMANIKQLTTELVCSKFKESILNSEKTKVFFRTFLEKFENNSQNFTKTCKDFLSESLETYNKKTNDYKGDFQKIQGEKLKTEILKQFELSTKAIEIKLVQKLNSDFHKKINQLFEEKENFEDFTYFFRKKAEFNESICEEYQTVMKEKTPFLLYSNNPKLDIHLQKLKKRLELDYYISQWISKYIETIFAKKKDQIYQNIHQLNNLEKFKELINNLILHISSFLGEIEEIKEYLSIYEVSQSIQKDFKMNMSEKITKIFYCFIKSILNGIDYSYYISKFIRGSFRERLAALNIQFKKETIEEEEFLNQYIEKVISDIKNDIGEIIRDGIEFSNQSKEFIIIIIRWVW